MTTVSVKLSQSVVDTMNVYETRSGDAPFAEVFDLFFQMDAAFGTAHPYYSAMSWNGSTLKLDFPDGAATVFSGVTLADPGAASGAASASSVLELTPGVLQLSLTGAWNFQYGPSGLNTTGGTMTSVAMQTLLPVGHPAYDGTVGNVRASMQGSLDISEWGPFSGVVTSLHSSADRFLVSETITGAFSIYGNAQDIAQGRASTTVSGTINSYSSQYDDGSYEGISAASITVAGYASLGEQALAVAENFPNSDVFDIALPARVYKPWVIATGAGDDTVSLAGAGALLSADLGEGNDTVVLKDFGHAVWGGNGTDMAVFGSALAAYTISSNDRGYSVSSQAGANSLGMIERLHFSDAELGLDIDGSAGQVYRLYKAAFARTPDLAGLGGWIKAVDEGLSLEQVAAAFGSSAEFQSLYGNNTSNEQFVKLLYLNALGRAPEAGGISGSNSIGGSSIDGVSISGTAPNNYKDVMAVTTVSFSGLTLGGVQAGNYSLTIQSPVSATITPKSLSTSGLDAPASKVSDGTTATAVSGTLVLSTDALGSGISVASKAHAGDDVFLVGTALGTYDDKDAADAETAQLGSLALTGVQAHDYSQGLQVPVSASLTPKSLSISGLSVPDSKVYDGTIAAVVTGIPVFSIESPGSGDSMDGKAYAGDEVFLVGTALGTYNDKDVADATTVNFSGLTLSGAQANNYSQSMQSPVSASITPKSLSMSGLSVLARKVYDGTTAAAVTGTPVFSTEAPGGGNSMDGKAYEGDEVFIVGTALGTYNDKDVADATTVSFSGLMLSGAQASNYSLSMQSPVSASITPRSLNISAPASKVYDGTTATVVSAWAGQIASGAISRAQLLVQFSESAENTRAVADSIANGIIFTTAEQAAGAAQGRSIVGTSGADSLIGSVGNDSFNGGPGSDDIKGGHGLDTALYSGKRASYTITPGAHLIVTGGSAGRDTLTDVERLKFADAALAFDLDGNAGQTYRLYQAAFDRTPDKAGLSDWVRGMDGGMTLRQVASGFINSPEFQGLYGAHPTDEALVTLLYQNVLHRAPDMLGQIHWLDELGRGLTREMALIGFSESAENQAALIGVMENGIEYLAG